MIEVIDLCKSFGDLSVLKGINLKIEQGEKVVIIGPSGSGKSTLLRCLNCMEDPTSGKVLYHGVDLTDMKVNINRQREKIGMVFQHFNLFNNKTVIENIMLSPVLCEKRRMRKLRRQRALGKADTKEPVKTTKQIKEEAHKNALELLDRIGLADKADVYPSQLSGGQKQRVAVAGIIAMKPMCIVLDEPTAMLDPSGRKEVLSTIKKLNKEDGITIVLITHYMDEAVQADRVVVMDGGEIKLDDTPQNVFSKFDEVKSLGLDVPQSTELIHRLGLKSENTILNADDCVKFLKKTLEAKV